MKFIEIRKAEIIKINNRNRDVARLRNQLFKDVKKRLLKMGITSKKDLLNNRSRIIDMVMKDIEKIMKEEIKAMYQNEKSKIAFELGVQSRFGDLDRLIVDRYFRSRIFTRSMININSHLHRKIGEAIRTSFEKEPYNMKFFKEQLSEVMDATEGNLKRIARTETHAFTNTARAVGYDEAEKRRKEKFEYDWIGPRDWRTTKYCRDIQDEIARRRSNGEKITLDVIKKIIYLHRDKNLKYYREFVPHINCRHVLVRHISTE